MTADEFKAARDELRLSGPELAELLDVSLRNVRAWETGKNAERDVPVPRMVEIILRSMLKYPTMRRDVLSRYK